jgi:hypothetical protein
MPRAEESGSIVLSSIVVGAGWGARPLRVSDVIAVKNARSRREASRIDVDLRVFELVFFSDTLLGVADSERAAFWDPETGEPSVEFTRFGIGRVS